eukprot:scaffold8194_cov248-Pinguiococcus_pyrenoidosus.AAC.3
MLLGVRARGELRSHPESLAGREASSALSGSPHPDLPGAQHCVLREHRRLRSLHCVATRGRRACGGVSPHLSDAGLHLPVLRHGADRLVVRSGLDFPPDLQVGKAGVGAADERGYAPRAHLATVRPRSTTSADAGVLRSRHQIAVLLGHCGGSQCVAVYLPAAADASCRRGGVYLGRAADRQAAG